MKKKIECPRGRPSRELIIEENNGNVGNLIDNANNSGDENQFGNDFDGEQQSDIDTYDDDSDGEYLFPENN